MAKVPEGDTVAAVKRLQEQVMNQQWTSNWSIKRIYTTHLGESRRLGRFAPKDEHHLFIAVRARDHRTLLNKALPKIHRVLGGPHPHGHVVFSAMESNGG